MKFSYDWIKDYIEGKTPEPRKMADLLTMHSFEVEEVKKVGSDWLFDIDVLPNRAGDCLSHLGVARECAALAGLKFQPPRFAVKEDKKIKARDLISVRVKNPEACSRYSAMILSNLKIGPSPKWIQERLKICGLRPINNIVDITNYVMLETGQPLHAFDLEKIEGKEIIVRFAKKGEKITSLDGQEFNLDSEILVIADAKKPMGIAGIKGSKSAEISSSTKTIVIESANFSPLIIRKASKKLKIITDASFRFERGIDSNLTASALERTASLIQKTIGAMTAKEIIDFYPQKVLPKKIKLNLFFVRAFLGVEIPKKEIKEILNKLGFDYKEAGKEILLVEIPTRRMDVILPEDLIEEIGRIYGYQRIPAVFPLVSLTPSLKNHNLFWQNFCKNILKESGFTEVYNYSFIGDKEAKNFGYKKEELLEIENPVSSELKYLSPSLIPNLLKNIQKNQNFFEEIKIFELGKVFLKKNTGEPIERRRLSGLISREAFYELKGVVDLFFSGLGISNFWYDEYQISPEGSKMAIWQLERCAEIKIDNTEIGFLGEIAPSIIEDLKLKNKVTVFDLDFEKLAELASEEHEYRPISKFPAAVRDIAVLVPRKVLVEDVLNKIEIAGGAMVRDVDLFDIYEGEELPGGKKNLAFHIIYQAEDRTLSSQEIDLLQEKIIKVLEEDPEWQVRR